jgi:hypothetical protein
LEITNGLPSDSGAGQKLCHYSIGIESPFIARDYREFHSLN